jgi:dephospho-CoA kinase
LILGLTGGYCAGKNAVAEILERKGWACIDVDRLGHDAIETAKGEITRRFGDGVLAPDGRVDRRELARIVFSDSAALADQESIVHPIALRLMDERIAAAASAAAAAGVEPRICVNAALLHRTGRIASCDAVLEVRAPLLVRAWRGMKRDRSGLLAALRRIWRQRVFPAALRAAARESGRSIIVLRNAFGRRSLERAVEKKLILRRGGLFSIAEPHNSL